MHITCTWSWLGARSLSKEDQHSFSRGQLRSWYRPQLFLHSLDFLDISIHPNIIFYQVATPGTGYAHLLEGLEPTLVENQARQNIGGKYSFLSFSPRFLCILKYPTVSNDIIIKSIHVGTTWTLVCGKEQPPSSSLSILCLEKWRSSIPLSYQPRCRKRLDKRGNRLLWGIRIKSEFYPALQFLLRLQNYRKRRMEISFRHRYGGCKWRLDF